jgi:hypothetical protein
VVVAAPRDPEVVSPADPLLPPQVGALEGRDDGEDVDLLDQLPPLLLLNDLELPLLPLLLPPLDPRARTSPHRESTKTKATISESKACETLNDCLCITSS